MITSKHAAFWGVPVTWALLGLVVLRLPGSELAQVLPPLVLALLGVGGARAVAGSRAGTAGLAAELVLTLTAVGELLVQPPQLRPLVMIAGACLASSLVVVGLWPSCSERQRRQLACLVGAGAGVAAAASVVGSPGAAFKLAAVVAAASLLARILCELAPASLALLATLVVAAISPSAPLQIWILSLLAATALVQLARRRLVAVVLLAVACSWVAPHGLAVAVGLVIGVCRKARSPLPVLLLAPVTLFAWLRCPAGASLLATPQLEQVLPALPLTFTSPVLLLPLLALSLLARSSPAGEGRDVLATGLLCLPFLAPEQPSVAACTALWLTALPAAARLPRLAHHLRRQAPWTVGSCVIALSLAGWGGPVLVSTDPRWLCLGWVIALLASFIPWRAARLAWLLPAAGLCWLGPLEGLDHHLEAHQSLLLPTESQGWELQVHSGAAGNEPGDTLAIFEHAAAPPLVSGTLCPSVPGTAERCLTTPTGWGSTATLLVSGTMTWAHSSPLEVTATAPIVLRAEPRTSATARRRLLTILMLGVAVLLLLAHFSPAAADRPLAVAVGVLLAAVIAAGSAVVPLGLTVSRGLVDVALFVGLAGWMAQLGWLKQRRFVAGVLLLVPLALAQPLLRHPAGDEVYHFKLAQSLRSDADLDITNNIDPDNPGEALYLRHGQELIHSPVPALLTFGGYLLLGWRGVLVLIAVGVAGGAALVARRADELGLGSHAVSCSWLLLLLSYPATTFATQLWPGSLALLLVPVLLAAAARPAPVLVIMTALMAAVIKVRLALVALPVAIVSTLVTAKRRVLLLLMGAASAAAVVLWAIFGSALGRHHLGELIPSDPRQPFVTLWGLAWDGAAGLAFSAPLWLLAAALLPTLWRRGGAGERGLIVGAIVTLAALLPRGEWYGGGAPPARYLVPLLALAQLGLAVALSRQRWRRLVKLVLPASAVFFWVAATRPLLLFNAVDAGWWLADRLAVVLGGAARSYLPTLLRPQLATLVVPLLLCSIGWWWARRSRRAEAGVTIVLLGTLCLTTLLWRPHRVEAEDPQVVHDQGESVPPPGSFMRAYRALSWRIPPDGAIEIPWAPPVAHRLVVRARLSQPGAGEMLASWDGLPAQRLRIVAAQWHAIALRPPPTWSRHRLRLQWRPRSPSGPDLLVDAVAARRQ